jgi:DNA-binding NarL/FixJ family response regulator
MSVLKDHKNKLQRKLFNCLIYIIMPDNLLFPHLLLIDDHAMFRSGLRMMLSFEIPGAKIFEASSVDEVITHAPEFVDVVLLDILMKESNGLDGIALLKSKWPLASILVLSSLYDRETVQLALNLGACGFVSKAETVTNMIESINLILQGNTSDLGNTDKARSMQLTPRQREVLDLLYQGLSNKLIARQLSLSTNTVRRHVQDILEYFHVSTRAEAVFLAHGQRRI